MDLREIGVCSPILCHILYDEDPALKFILLDERYRMSLTFREIVGLVGNLRSGSSVLIHLRGTPARSMRMDYIIRFREWVGGGL
jgi:hypothetical protein